MTILFSSFIAITLTQQHFLTLYFTINLKTRINIQYSLFTFVQIKYITLRTYLCKHAILVINTTLHRTIKKFYAYTMNRSSSLKFIKLLKLQLGETGCETDLSSFLFFYTCLITF